MNRDCCTYFEGLIDNIYFDDAIHEYLYVSETGVKSVKKYYFCQCPFCHDLGALKINSKKRIGYCLRCKENGDIFNLVAKVKKITISESLLELAKKYNIQLMDTHSDECRNTSSSG